MVVAPSKLKFVESFGDSFSDFGRWDALAAEDSNRRFLGWMPVYDHDFFPESPFEYAETIRKALNKGIADPIDFVQPLQVDIDITQTCNSSCTFCFSRQYQNEHYRNAIISSERLDTILQELARLGTKCVRFTGGGDALTHQEIKALLPLPHAHGMHLSLISNIDLLSEDLLDDIFCHVDHLRWSVNAISDDCRLSIHRSHGNANSLSKSISYIKDLLNRRRQERCTIRRPMVWATFLLLPENVNEIVEFGVRMREIGVDGIFFRPVFHGLMSTWTCDDKNRMSNALSVVESLARPGFNVFVSRQKFTMPSSKPLISHYSRCLSRRFRTVLEASHDGPILQFCGAYRGTGSDIRNRLDVQGNFQKTWESISKTSFSENTCLPCETCFNVSFNRILSFILHVLQIDINAHFRRAIL